MHYIICCFVSFQSRPTNEETKIKTKIVAKVRTRERVWRACPKCLILIFVAIYPTARKRGLFLAERVYGSITTLGCEYEVARMVLGKYVFCPPKKP